MENGTRVRAATTEDAEAVCALLNAVDEIEIGAPETALGEVEEDLAKAREAWVAVEGGRTVAYAAILDAGADGGVDIDHYVLPDRQDAGIRLLDLAEARSRELAAEAGAPEAVVHLHLNAAPTMDAALLTGRGWRTVRRHHVLTRPIAPGADPVPEPPAGVRLRPCADDADRRAAHRLHQETFARHFDFRPQGYEQWLRQVAPDWPLVWIAAVEGIGDAAVLITRDDREGMGWIRTLGVLEQVRGRGLASHLLRHAFAVYALRGRDTIGLGVDTENVTGALRLYESHGMGVHYAVDTWEVRLGV
ncbi:acetyltransferase [Streptomyces sp. ERV7]|uniref:GNAT family N-acetyltransferase n=1 Tax=Streptomyces sp. ERV7 TaxID=1322334 RepID=UPI0007F4A6B1|nr:GNAT family N-acetyltransferase [Streptomyces sp. ERV7]OAR24648.1 acetyltransferase [Streptomyces sp. ERV7]